MKSTYFLILFLTVIVPFVFSFHPKLRFHKTFIPFFTASIMVAAFFIAWDIWFTNLKVWGFNPDYVSGIVVFNLPIEEVLFFICIPFSCVFTYHSLTQFYQFKWNPKTESRLIFAIAFVLFLLGILYHQKAYTTSTFLSLSVILILIRFGMNAPFIGKVFSIYPILLIPFFIVNGILTGTGLDQPVVWYNDAENLGIRLFTIPIEDVFYGFELILLNIFAYEYLLKSKQQNVLSRTKETG